MTRDDALSLADRVLALVNSKPATPSREEIAEIIWARGALGIEADEYTVFKVTDADRAPIAEAETAGLLLSSVVETRANRDTAVQAEINRRASQAVAILPKPEPGPTEVRPPKLGDEFTWLSETGEACSMKIVAIRKARR